MHTMQYRAAAYLEIESQRRIRHRLAGGCLPVNLCTGVLCDKLGREQASSRCYKRAETSPGPCQTTVGFDSPCSRLDGDGAPVAQLERAALCRRGGYEFGSHRRRHTRLRRVWQLHHRHGSERNDAPRKKETGMAENWCEMPVLKLLRTHAKAMEELVRRDIAIAADNPVGGYAEVLVCQRLGLERMPRNHPGFDGLDANTQRYQIKGRRKSKGRVHSGPLRHLEERRFDYLVMVVFNADFTVHRADKIPHDVVLELANYQKGNRYHIFWMTDAVRADSRVENITDLLLNGID